MRRLLPLLLTALAVSFGFSATAAADEEADAEQRVVIVDFEMVNVDDEVMDQFYGRLRNVLADLEGMRIASGGNVSMSDLLLMVGCDEPTSDCLSMAADFVDGDLLLYGSVQRSDDVHMFSISLFDFAGAEIVKEVSDRTLRGDDQWLAEGIPAVIEHFAFGETASLQVNVSGADDAEVKVNGQVVGAGTTHVEGLAPGEAVVAVTGPDGAEHQERIILRHDHESEVNFSVDPSVADIDRPDGDMSPMLIPGLAASGLGVVGLVIGLVGQSQLSGAESEANTLVSGRSAIEADQLSRAQQLQNDMNTANTMRIAGFSAGGLSLIAGGALLYMAFSGDSSQGASDDLAGSSLRLVDVDLSANADGVGAGLRFRF